MHTFVISVPERASELAKTLPQIQLQGFTPDVIMPNMTVSQLSNCEQSMRGITEAVRRGEDVMMFEDDISIHPFLFPEWLHLAQSQSNPVTLCMLRRECLHPTIQRAIQKCEAVPFKLYEVQEIPKWFGSQCLYIPLGIAQKLVTHGIPRGYMGSFDMLFKEWLVKTNTPLLHCASDPVQHRAPVCVVNKDRIPYTSVSYGLELLR